MIHLITLIFHSAFSYPVTQNPAPRTPNLNSYIFCNFAAEIKGCFNRLRLYPMNLEQVMLFRDASSLGAELYNILSIPFYSLNVKDL